jgi:hypothetical protein
MIRANKERHAYRDQMKPNSRYSDRPITLDDFASMLAIELGLSHAEQEEITRRTEVRGFSCWGFIQKDTPNAYYADDVYRSLRYISREEAATLIVEAADLVGIGSALSSSEIMGILSRYKDATLVSEWAKPALATAVCFEWIDCEYAEMKPKNYLTPHEAVMIAHKFAESTA